MFREWRKEDAADVLRNVSTSGTGDYVTDKYLEYITNLSTDEKSGVFRFVMK